MKDRLRHIAWWQRAPAAVLLGAVVYALSVDGALSVVVGVSAVLASLAAIAQVLLQGRNPFEPRPKPHVTFAPVDGDETTSLTFRATLRPVDLDAVVEDAEATARVLGSSTGLVAMSQYAKPTKADHDKFEKALAAYTDDVRAWARAGEAWLYARATVLVANVIHHNPTSVDALEAGIYIFLPPGSEEYEETDPPEAPERPTFPRRRAGFIDPVHDAGMPSHRNPLVGLRANLHRVESITAYSPDAPSYETMRDGTLEVFYGRWPIRHREDEVAGEPFSVSLPVGEHKVRWEVRATNLPHHATGTWTLSVQVEQAGEPIKTVRRLEAALRGEPEDTVDRATRLRKRLQ